MSVRHAERAIRIDRSLFGCAATAIACSAERVTRVRSAVHPTHTWSVVHEFGE